MKCDSLKLCEQTSGQEQRGRSLAPTCASICGVSAGGYTVCTATRRACMVGLESQMRKPLGDRQNHEKALSFTGKEWLDTRCSMSRFPTRPRVHSCEGASVHDDMPYADSEGFEKSRILGHERDNKVSPLPWLS